MYWTVSRRIAAGFALGLALVGLVAWVGISALRSSTAAYQDALDQERRVLVTALDAESEGRIATVQFLRFLLVGDEAFARAHDSSVAVARALLEQVRESAVGIEGRALWSEALTALSNWEEASRPAVAAKRARRDAEALRLQETRVYPARLALRSAIERGVARANQQTDSTIQAARDAATGDQQRLVLSALAALIVGVLAAVFLNRAVSNPLRETAGVLASSAAEILAATTQQASGANESSAAVAETVTTVDEVTQTADQAAQRAKAMADSAQRAVDESGAAMKALREQVESIAESILALAEQAQGIGGAVEEGDDGGAADSGRDPAGHECRRDDHRARDEAGDFHGQAGDRRGGRGSAGGGADPGIGRAAGGGHDPDPTSHGEHPRGHAAEPGLDQASPARRAGLELPRGPAARVGGRASPRAGREGEGDVNRNHLAARLLQTFLGELEEQLRGLNAELLALESSPSDPERLRSVFRIVHTLKGAARAASLPLIEQTCHQLETLLAEARDGKTRLARQHFRLLFAAADALGEAGARLKQGTSLDGSPLAKLADTLREGAADREGPVIAETAPVPAPPPQAPGAAEGQLRIQAAKLDTLLAATSELQLSRSRLAARAGEVEALHDLASRSTASWRQGSRRIRLALERAGASAAGQALTSMEDSLQQVTHQLGDLARAARDDAHGLLMTADSVQQRVRELRMRLFADACETLPRAVRDLAAAAGKEIDLHLAGGEVEADRTVLDGLRDALLQLVRNAVDHGIEPPAVRDRSDKPRRGTVAVGATLQGDRLAVTVSDDGAGLDVPAAFVRM